MNTIDEDREDAMQERGRAQRELRVADDWSAPTPEDFSARLNAELEQLFGLYPKATNWEAVAKTYRKYAEPALVAWRKDRVRLIASEQARQRAERLFPMQDGPSIPWSLAERIYLVYADLSGREQSLERLAERGGFGWAEVPTLRKEYFRKHGCYPDWTVAPAPETRRSLPWTRREPMI